MKRNSHFINYTLICVLSFSINLSATGKRIYPLTLHSLKTLYCENINHYAATKKLECIPATDSVFPSNFHGTGQNIIEDSSLVLDPIYEHLSAILTSKTNDTLRIVHIGDSHIKGHIFPQTVGKLLAEAFGSLVYTDMGINGATCHTYARSKKLDDVFAAKPDLIILSFGTNESYGYNYNSNIHYKQIDELVKILQNRLPNTKLLLTTPPGSYFRHNRYKQGTTTANSRLRASDRKFAYTNFVVNPNNAKAALTICQYAKDHSLPYWDLYQVVGGEQWACRNWVNAQLMRPDHVHYIPNGYRLQGKLLYQAFIKAYNEYICR